MEDMIVWRMEDEQGRGPYTAPLQPSLVLLRTAHNRDGRHWGWKSPKVALEACKWSEWVAGCPTARDLHEWFAGFHEKLELAGFRTMCYLVPMSQVRRGSDPRQLAFLKAGSQRMVINQ